MIILSDYQDAYRRSHMEYFRNYSSRYYHARKSYWNSLSDEEKFDALWSIAREVIG